MELRRSSLIGGAVFGALALAFSWSAEVLGAEKATPSHYWINAPFKLNKAPVSGGNVEVLEVAQARKYQVNLGKFVVLKTDDSVEKGEFSDFPMPTIVAHFAHAGDGGGDLVVVQQDEWGDACPMGPVWFLEVSDVGQPKRSRSIDWCGPDRPRFITDGKAVVMTFPPIKPDDQNGHRGVPGETWSYQDGQIRRRR